MFLSQLLINPGSHPDAPRPGIDWIKQTYRVHQRLWMAFPDKERLDSDPYFLGTWDTGKKVSGERMESGFLYRIEPDPPLRILVQSAKPPHWDYAFQNAKRLLAAEPQVREIEPVYTSKAEYRFRIVMLMVKRVTTKLEGGVKKSREVPIQCVRQTDSGLVPDPHRTAWRERLSLAASRHGFTAEDTVLNVQPVTNLCMKPEPNKVAQRYNAAMFEGVLKCDDPAKLTDAVCRGIGRGKAFGMGLLSLAELV